MEAYNDIEKIINYCQKYAITDLKNDKAIPFGVIINQEGELLVVDNQKDLPEVDIISPKNVIDTLTRKLGLKLFLEEITVYAITYYGKVQINYKGDQSDAFIINIEDLKNEDHPLYIFPYSWSKDRELIMGEPYRMRKKEGRFYSSN
jgi:hypothetical protein